MSDGRRLKVATRDLVRKCGGQEAAALDAGKSQTTVQRWTDRNNPDGDFINVRDLAVLEAVAGDPIVTRQLCQLAGGVFVPVVDATADPDTLAGMVMDMVVRIGAISSEMRAALADRICEPFEARRLLELQAEHDTAAAHLRLALERIASTEDDTIPGAAPSPDPSSIAGGGSPPH